MIYMEDNMPEKKYICKDQDGNILDLIDKMSEEELSESPLFTHCLAVVKVGDCEPQQRFPAYFETPWLHKVFPIDNMSSGIYCSLHTTG